MSIILVSIVGTGFIWAYHLANTAPSESLAVVHHPMVLGAATGEPTVTPLAAETATIQSPLRPSDVNRLFLEFCHRPARLTEMDAWTNAAPAKLTAAFANIPNCQ